MAIETRDAFDEAWSELGLDTDSEVEAETPDPEVDPELVADGEPEDGPDEGDVTGDAEQDEDAEGEDGDEPTVIEISEGATLRLPDGTEVPADKATLLQADYTKKMQQIADERRELESEREEFKGFETQVSETFEQMRDWYEQRVSNPSSWVQEIAEGSDNPTRVVAVALTELAKAGRLDPKFVEAFGLEAGDSVVATTAGDARSDAELAEVKRRLDERDRSEAEKAEISKRAATYQGQWDTIVSSHGVSFDGPEAEVQAKRDLLAFAQERGLEDLTDAYDLMVVRKGPFATAKPREPEPDPAVIAKKRASRAVTPRSSSGGGTRTASPTRDTRSAALAAIEEFSAGA